MRERDKSYETYGGVMRKSIMIGILVICLMVSLNGCVYVDNYDTEGNLLDESEVIDAIKTQIDDAVKAALSGDGE